jgi:hypothetical protein
MASDSGIDTSAFSKMVRALANITASNLETTLKSEIASVLARAAKFTKTADTKKIRATIDKSKLKATTKKTNLKNKLGARGLSKKTWVQLAATLGQTLKVPKFVENAKPQNGKNYGLQVSSSSSKTKDNLSITIENHQPTVVGPGIDGAKILNMALAGRVKFFEDNLKRKLFNDLAKAAKRYPGISATT